MYPSDSEPFARRQHPVCQVQSEHTSEQSITCSRESNECMGVKRITKDAVVMERESFEKAALDESTHHVFTTRLEVKR